MQAGEGELPRRESRRTVVQLLGDNHPYVLLTGETRKIFGGEEKD